MCTLRLHLPVNQNGAQRYDTILTPACVQAVHPLVRGNDAAVSIGLGRIVASYHRSSRFTKIIDTSRFLKRRWDPKPMLDQHHRAQLHRRRRPGRGVARSASLGGRGGSSSRPVPSGRQLRSMHGDRELDADHRYLCLQQAIPPRAQRAAPKNLLEFASALGCLSSGKGRAVRSFSIAIDCHP